MFEIRDYIIDFDRVNELSSTKDDKPEEGFMGVYHFNLSRKIVKEYLEIFSDFYIKGKLIGFTTEKLEHVIKTLTYNKILVDRSTTALRDAKLDDLLKEDLPF